VEPFEEDLDVLQSVVEVESGIERVGRELDVGVELEQLAQIHAFVPRPERVPLNKAISLVPREAGLDEGQKDSLAEDEAMRGIEIRAHPLRIDDEAVDQPREPVEHVVESQERIGDDHSLGARVRDIPFVPERDVLEPDRRPSPHDPREAADALCDDGIALMRHRRASFLCAAERLLNLPDLRPGEVPDLERESLERSGAEGQGREEPCVAVSRDDLRGHRLGHEAEQAAGDPFHLRVASAVDADRACELPDADSRERALEAIRVALELECPAGDLRAEGDRLRVDTVRAPDHRRVPVFLGAPDNRGERSLDPLEQEDARLPRLQGEGGVEDVGGREPEVEPAAVVAELLGNGVDEGGEVVLGALLDLRDPLGRGRHRALADALDGIGRHGSDLGPAGQRSQLDLEPAGEPALVRPDSLHGRAGVARDHRLDSRARGGRPERKLISSPIRIVGVAMMTRKRVLVIEDERPIAEPLADALRLEGFEVQLADTADSGLKAFSARPPDIVLLDVMLPDGDGREVLREIRQLSRTPVVMLSARGEEMDRVLGLELGADDYVTKPFSAAELVARMRAVLRRSSSEPAVEGGGVLRSGDVAMNLETRGVTREDEAVDLTVKEFELLRVLLENAGRLVKREALVAEVWDPNWFGSTKTLDVHVSSLRKKLGDDPTSPRYIHTVRGVGFRFSAADEQP
jgi:two-component system, OmpR family, response regulator RegX3